MKETITVYKCNLCGRKEGNDSKFLGPIRLGAFDYFHYNNSIVGMQYLGPVQVDKKILISISVKNADKPLLGILERADSYARTNLFLLP